MSAFTTADIRLQTAVSMTDLEDLHLDITGGSHAVISLKGCLPEEEGQEALDRAVGDAPLRVCAGDKILFAGLMSGVEVTREGRRYQLSIQGISATAYLDREKKDRVFQNGGDTYRTVMEKVLADMPDAVLRFRTEDQMIGTPFYQMGETDWEFIKRLASFLGRQVFPAAVAEGPDLWIGLPQGRSHDREELGVLGSRVWHERTGKGICREILTYEDLPVGDSIRWDGRTLQIVEKHCRLEKGFLCFRYKSAERNGDHALPSALPGGLGRLLAAEVMEAKDEQVRVRFPGDGCRQEEAYWYPWEPDAGNLLYCMPEKGERVYICPGDHLRQRDRAVCGIHRNGAGNPEMRATDRYFTTADGKRMYLLPGKMGFQDQKQDSPLEIALKDDSGAELVSGRNITILAKDTVGIKGKNLFFQAPKEISLVRKDSLSPAVINMCNGFDSIGASNEVSMKGGAAGFPEFSGYQQEEGREYSLEGMEKEVSASTPCRRLESAGWQQIRGAQADYINAG